MILSLCSEEVSIVSPAGCHSPTGRWRADHGVGLFFRSWTWNSECLSIPRRFRTIPCSQLCGNSLGTAPSLFQHDKVHTHMDERVWCGWTWPQPWPQPDQTLLEWLEHRLRTRMSFWKKMAKKFPYTHSWTIWVQLVLIYQLLLYMFHNYLHIFLQFCGKSQSEVSM